MDASSHYPSITWTPQGVADSLRRVVEEHRQAVGARLRSLRKAHGWSQEEAAYRVGVTLKTWGDWERGKRDPYDGNWKKIGEAFEVDPADVRGTPVSPLALGAPTERSLNDDLSSRLDRLEEIAQQNQRLLIAVAAAAGLIEQPAAVQARRDLEPLLERIEQAAGRDQPAKRPARATRRRATG